MIKQAIKMPAKLEETKIVRARTLMD